MSTAPTFQLPAPLAAAVQRVKQAARSAAERTVESLGLAAMAAHNTFQRDALLSAQFELNRKLGAFVQAFSDAFDEQVRRDCGPRGGGTSGTQTANWDQLSLVEDRELEIKVAAERFGLEIAHSCEWELRELEAYVGSVLGHARAERDRNPLRPELVGHGVIRAVAVIADRPEVRKVLDAELNRSLAAVLRNTYGDIISDMRKSGVQPVSLSVRTTDGRGEHSRAGAFDARPIDRSGAGGRGSTDSQRDARSSTSGALGPRSSRAPLDAADTSRRASLSGRGPMRGTPIGQVDAGMMDLLRRLAFSDPAGADVSGSAWSGDGSGYGSGTGIGALPNLIHANRDELRQASRGAIDHMVIDVIGSLFDQILSDPKVPPQLARQIARLQLPVLRAALGDPSFFSTRKHPVRQFINRIASLGNGFDDFSDEQAQTFVAKVRDLVQEIVKGDFDQMETYETRLAQLEAFVAEQARNSIEAQRSGATALLQQREEALRMDRHYAQRLEDELQPLAAPEFVRDFVSRVWSRVILKTAEREGVTSESVRALRQAGRDLFMSVQPKTSPGQRKAFLSELPKLMQQINAGLNAIGWPDDRRRAFFGQLMPAHADALKAQTGRVLDFNMLQRQVEQALERGLPTRADLPPASAAEPAADDLATPAFTKEEAARLGFVDESSIDWDGKIDIDLSAEPPLTTVDLELPGLTAAADAMEVPEPASGRSLADHVQIGFSYQMHVEGEWQKVRLAHVSPGRSFFVFTRGQRHQQTISLTHRMLVRLCESGRMRAFESAQLLDRATARARRQLASLPGAAVR
ncbi:MAG: DUF1631 family protein [Rubrivivax sp.]|nr:DUF1631 family protein [Rubrivivax sp.]